MANPLACIALIIAGTLAVPASAAAATFRDAPGSFTQLRSNNVPLAFGMTADDAAIVLATPIAYLSGKPGDEIFLATRHHGGSGYFDRQDRLYLQFRKGRLTGWKGDWGTNWMWR